MTTSNTYLPRELPAPLPSGDGLDRPYWEAAKRNELVVQRCNDCGNYQWGPEWNCYKCLSFNIGWVNVSGRGKVYSWERVWHPVHPALVNACPYLVVLVELPDAGNVRMIGNLLGDPMQQVSIGAEVEARFEDHGEFKLVQWEQVS